ncbi:MAG: DUF3108 domain-containing protein [Muribaculaceae bacterium]|nr:DUF3108 domain-containing protein [Muribaculaceae bacterium]
MRKIIFIILVAVVALLPGAAIGKTTFADETLRYVITYKWGLITKDSGEAVLSLKNQGGNYNIRLTGKTKPWADGFFSVRDTLVSVISKKDFRPLSYTKVAHEGGKYSKDVIKYSYSGSSVKGTANKHREKKGKVTSSDIELSATGETYDMLSVFYWLRTIDLSTLPIGKTLTATLFSGSYAETVKIWKVGSEKVKLRSGSVRDAWHIRFTFTSKGGKKTSDDVNAWISSDGKAIPLEIRASLPLGKVSAYLISE